MSELGSSMRSEETLPPATRSNTRERAQRSRALRACLLSLSVIADDPRVRRQGDALHAAGWEVSAIGLGGARSTPPDWRIIELPPPGEPGLVRRMTRAGALFVGGRIGAMRSLHRHVLFPRFESAAQGLPAVDLYVANDWPMLPLAATLARRAGAAYVYDSHELATAEYGDSRKWRLVNFPYVRTLERRYVGGAAAILTVSAGIAEALHRLYQPATAPAVIRNMPNFREVARHSVDPRRIEVLYHGVVAPGRGLEALIAGAAAWRPEFRLTIRGPASPAYAAALRSLVAAGEESRIVLAPPVRPDELIDAAAEADIGVVAMAGDNLNMTLALPNKFFEYVMAGLALCVSDLPEMAALVRRFELGRLMSANTAGGIAAAVNGFDAAAIERFRENARTAARELNWQTEARRLVEICERAVVAARS